MNMMLINGQKAAISYDEDMDMFRGEFVGLNGGADFYALDIQGLHQEGQTSLQVFLDMCDEDGVEPYKRFSGKFNVRINPDLHANIVAAAKSKGESLNQFVAETLEQAVQV
ncbi:MAG: type II toxin-antitoxin system HicB family antitoxin [Mariprofundaceae bacterium]|nr:type II toxin-antitoxin system HicB family antitoxin [Mariprofundaceae bacterium]